MDKNVVMEFGEEHDGQTYNYPIGVLAKNVQEDDEHQFVSKKWKNGVEKQIKDLEDSTETFNNRLSDMTLEREGDTIYIVYGEGADTVRKKLGNDFAVYKSVDLKKEKDINNVKEITVDCRDIQGYAQYSDADFLVAPTSVYENHIGFSNTYTLDKVSWEYSNGILTIHNRTIGLGDAYSDQTLTMWYSSFDIYTR